MGTTLDGKTLHVQEITDPRDIVGAEWDAWENGSYKRKMKPYGAIQKWTLECYEKGVAWDDSVVKYLKDKVGGDAVPFVSDQGTVINTNVYILSVNLTINPGDAPINFREFTIELQEKM